MRHHLLVVAGWIGLLGCGTSEQPEPDAPQVEVSVELLAPWVEMGLPLEGSELELCTESSLSVVYEGTLDYASLGERYATHVKSTGWRPLYRDEGGGSMTTTFAREGEVLGLSVIEAEEATVVTMALSAL